MAYNLAVVDTAQFPPGEMLDDKYRIDRLLSMGGMGAVYVGTHVLLKKRVAIKVLRTEFAGAADMVVRFQREAVAASAIGHDNIVSVTDMGQTRGGVAFLVMELLEGRSLAAAIRDEGPLTIAAAADIASDLLGAIGAAHRAGIIHRDLKPENVFLSLREGRGEVVKILDFGISSITQAEPDKRLTVTGLVIGTPSYMSPEQARGDKEISGATDVYSAGVILYEMLCKQLPYEATNYNVLMYRILSGEYVKLSMRQASVPEDLEAVVVEAMALDPRDRFASADDFADALGPFRSGSSAVYTKQHTPRPRSKAVSVQASSAAPPTAEAVTADTVAAPSTAPDLKPPVPPPRSRKGLALGLAAGLVVLVGGIAAVAYKLNAGPAKSAAPAPAPAPAAAPAAAPAPAPVVTPAVIIDFAVSPPDAVITVDGKPLAAPRLTLPEPAAAAVAVHIEAPGYRPYDGRHTFDHSQSLVLRLDKKKPDRPGRPGGKPDKPDHIIKDSPYGD